MQEMSKMFGGRRRGTEWSVPWPYKGMTVYNLAHLQYMIFPQDGIGVHSRLL